MLFCPSADPRKTRIRNTNWSHCTRGVFGMSVAAALGLVTGCASSQQRVRDHVEVEAIHFKSDGASLSGTLYLPAGKPPYLAVVLFHGSGAQPRDSFSAHWFAEQGIAA